MGIETISGQCLVAGAAQGALLVSNTGLSFWGGVDPTTGVIVDQHHPLKGETVTGKILALPSGRGSCSGSGALLELLLNNKEPAALVFSELEEILTLGVVVAEVMFNRSIPVLFLSQQAFSRLQTGVSGSVDDDELRLFHQGSALEAPDSVASIIETPAVETTLTEGSPARSAGYQMDLDESDHAMLDGALGKASQVAMQILTRMAVIQGADKLIDITQAHIDACVYHGPSSLRFARRLVDWDAQVRVPTTLNSISVDKRRWKAQGVDVGFGQSASQLGDAYVDMGASASFTCAPYLLETAPVAGEQIVWAESNAVMFANSVLGARTQKYPDFLDVCIALTGRAPSVGCHLDSGRRPTICVEVTAISNADDSFWPLLGYHIGLHTGNELPMIYGLEGSGPSMDDLKAFSAAFATTSSTPMFHMMGVTPEASQADQLCKAIGVANTVIQVTSTELLRSWRELNTATESAVDMVCLGNPHFSLTECAALAALCAERVKHSSTEIMVTMGRAIHQQAMAQGHISCLEEFGVEFVTDTCWCMISDPVIPSSARTLMTNSGKYAHYGPGLVGRTFRFGGLADCVEAACSGQRTAGPPFWLENSTAAV